MKKDTMMPMFFRFTAAALLALLASCASTPDPGTPGMVYDDEGRPLSGVDVSAGGQLLTRSDINGRFILGPRFPTPPTGSLGRTLEFHRDGYEPGKVDLDAATEALPGSVVYVKMPSRDQLLKLTWAALDRSDFAEAKRLLERAHGLGREDSFWAVTNAALLLLDPSTPKGDLEAFVPGLLAGNYGPVEEGWLEWWKQKSASALRQ